MHVLAIALDPTVEMGMLGALVPMTSSIRQPWTDLGIVSAYGLIGIALSFAARRWIGNDRWRTLHYLTFGFWATALIHAIGAGTDTATLWAGAIYILSTSSVVFLLTFRSSRRASLSRPGQAGPALGFNRSSHQAERRGVMRVLVVDDERELAEIIGSVLEDERFDVDLAFDGEQGLDMALTGNYDVIVLDRLMPKLDGLDVCRQLRAEEVETPVLILSALGDLPQRVEGLDIGADDYLGKPFAFEELLARVRALGRRKAQPVLPVTLEVGPLKLDQGKRTVELAGEPIDLSHREFAMLEYLMRNAGQVLTRDQILERVWGYDADMAGNAVDLYVHYLRKKLDQPGRPAPIETVRGAGYRLRA
ncbi:MAG: response regulator transcription factor [Thermomicrobiales bacterium]